MMTGVILAGGLSRRMGQPKGLLTLSNEVMVTRLIRRMRPICNELLVIANEISLYKTHVPNDVKVTSDLTSGTGPLGGMEAAFKHASGDVLWIVGCDMPYVSPHAAKLLYEQLTQQEQLEAAVPVVDGKLHPLHGLYRSSVAGKVQQMVAESNLRLMDLLEQILWVRVEEQAFLDKGIATNFATNANTPEQWQQVQAQNAQNISNMD
ncbi:MAG: molybdopterin-guanine dinucleotide biosynthesis protein MobA [Paenibacillus sp.]|jgi:molybdopterin-guanine dinucleotide biosynthesis protein A|nr:molybdopterin-guanine dinucleotide biosynthesis protein MobA [Paenibacillus sp.]